MMDLPLALRNRIIDFLAFLPNIHDSNAQQALIYQAGVDFQLHTQLSFGKPTAQFVPNLVATLTTFGKLDDGRNALEAVLAAAQNQVGADRRAECERIIGELQILYKQTEGKPETLFPQNAKKPSPVLANPFGDRGRIVEPKRFFNREELLRQILEALHKGNSVALIGEFRIGKSSTLSMIQRLGPKALKLPPEAFLYLDMQPLRNEDEFFEALCDDIGIPTCRGFKLARALRGKRYILCLDEVEKMNKKECFSRDIREELRGLAGSADAPFSLVIASRTPLERLFPDTPDMTSPLANICVKVDLKPFTPQVVRNFLLQRLQGSGVTFTEAHIAELIKKTGGHPGKLQDEAAQLYTEVIRKR